MFIYPRWEIDGTSSLAYMPGMAVVIGIALLWRLRNGGMKPVFFAVCYFVVSLFPLLGFFDVFFFRYSFVGDHFQYLASMGPLALAGAWISGGFCFSDERKKFPTGAVATVILLVLAVLTWLQCGIYRNVETLWRSTIAKNPACWMAFGNLGVELNHQGRTDEAIAQFRESLRINPAYAESHNNLGNALFQQGRTEEAIVEFRAALKIRPNYPEACYNFGNALMRQGQREAAIAQFRAAVKMKPAYPEARNNLGSALLEKGQTEEAIMHFREALKANPAYAESRYNLGNVLWQKGAKAEAVEQMKTALGLQPGDAGFQHDLAWMLATAPQASLRNGARALELASQSNRATGGNNPLYLDTLAAAYAAAGDYSNAVKTAETALQLAQAQSNTALADALRKEIKSYKAGQPFLDE